MSEFTVYGRPGCGYCVAAVQLLKTKGHAFEYIDIYTQGMAPADLSSVVGQTVRTVPQIIHGDQYVGGYTDLVPYLKKMEAA